MADLTPLDEKLGEVLGLAQAAQAATDTVSNRHAETMPAKPSSSRRQLQVVTASRVEPKRYDISISVLRCRLRPRPAAS